MKLLVVEDEHKIGNSIRTGLEQEKFIVDLAYDGEEGLDLALSESYDVIILDRLLPKIEGLEIVKKIRDSDIHTPILILTAKTQIQDRVEGLDKGADDYLTKPFAFTELLARIRALSRRPKKSNPRILKVGNLLLNPETFSVEREGRKIDLSSKEFSLLEYLMRHPKQTLRKNLIIQSVWTYDSDVLPNSVEVYIKHLRDKIDKPFKSGELIHTVRGFGYRIG